jgi:hypothetical protein
MYELDRPHDLSRPVLIVAFDGWVSAGAVGTAAADHIAGEGDTIARFDPDALFDFRVSRPTVEFENGEMHNLVWPAVTVRRRTLEGRDLLALTGIEPNWHWQAFGRAVADLAVDLGVVEQISLGGIPWAAPHTRPTEVTTTASPPDRLGDLANPPDGQLRVPAAMALVIEHYVAERSIPAVGFWARVPHYIGTTYFPGVVALVERVALHAGIPIPLGSLVDAAAEQRRQLGVVLESRPDARAMVARLEELAEQGDRVSGEEIAAEIERFLREAGEEAD